MQYIVVGLIFARFMHTQRIVGELSVTYLSNTLDRNLSSYFHAVYSLVVNIVPLVIQ